MTLTFSVYLMVSLWAICVLRTGNISQTNMTYIQIHRAYTYTLWWLNSTLRFTDCSASHGADEIPNIEFVGVPVWEHLIFAINPNTIQKVDRCSQGRAALNDISSVFFSWRVKGKSCGLSGLAGCSESTLGLQHALLLPGAGQRGGGGGGGDATRGAESLATGGCMSSTTIGRVFAKLSLWSSSPFISLKPGSRGQPEETGRGNGSFPVHVEKWRAGRK